MLLRRGSTLGKSGLIPLLTLLTLVLGSGCQVVAAKHVPDSLKWRQRHIIYNNDGCDAMIPCSSPEEFLRKRIDPALGTQVDSIFYCTGTTILYWHDTSVGEKTDDFQREFGYGNDTLDIAENMKMLRRNGGDTLSFMTKKVRSAGREIFFSHRMNDIHDAYPQFVFLLPKWKREHPECLMGRPEDFEKRAWGDPRKTSWSALDYEKPEVRRLIYRVLEEVCRNYDIDGIELDFMTMSLFFRPNLDGEAAAPDHRDILTSFVRDVRDMTVREGKRRGRPIMVAMRVPSTLEACLYYGIDIEEWLKGDLADLLMLNRGYDPFTMRKKAMTELGHKYHIPVYWALSESGFSGRYGLSPYPWRGAASNALKSGADGIYMFNYFPFEYNDSLSSRSGVGKPSRIWTRSSPSKTARTSGATTARIHTSCGR